MIRACHKRLVAILSFPTMGSDAGRFALEGPQTFSAAPLTAPDPQCRLKY
jgi:hypothetical protein